MTNRLYPSAREAFLKGDLDWDGDVRAYLLDASYVYSDAHDRLDDVGAGARIAGPVALSSKTTTNGVAGAAALIFSAVPGGDTITAVLLYLHTGVESTSRLIGYYDTRGDGAPISVATDGTDVTVFAPTDAVRFFRL